MFFVVEKCIDETADANIYEEFGLVVTEGEDNSRLLILGKQSSLSRKKASAP